MERKLILVQNTEEYATKTRKNRVIPMDEWSPLLFVEEEKE
jgi:hypothetical protein